MSASAAMACSPSPNSTKFDSARTALGAVEDVVVFGRNSVRVEPSSAVLGGDIAVEATAGSPYPTSGTLADGARISVGAWSTIGGDVVAATGLFEYGSELVDGNNFDRYAALDGVFYNGLVRGGVSLPMSPPPPAFPTVAPVTPGIGTLTVAAGTSQTLTASTSYDAIVVETGATLYLETGAHRVATVTTSTNANVIALDRVDLRIADALVLGADSVLTATTGFSAGDLRVDVAGFNSPPDPLATVRAVDLGDRADVRAIVFAPNGTAWVGEDAVVDGVVFARDVWVDFGATVAFEDGRDPYASDAPVAFSDGYTVSEEETLSVSAPGVLWNDYDPNQDAIVAELVTGTNSGTVALSTDGSFSYTPQMDFTGSDSFTYRVFDGTYYSPTATVTFSVDDEADAPRIVSEPERFSFVGALWDYTVVATDADTNETFTYALESESPAAATVDSGGVVEWTPASGDEGANVVSIVVTDSDGLETAQVRGIEVTTSPRSEYFALYATESVQVAGGAIIKGDVGAVQSGSGTFLGSGWWGTARTTVGGYVDGDVFGDTVALDYNSSVDDVYTDDLVFDQGTSAEDTASLPSMEALAATATAAVSGALVVSTGTTQTLSAGAALATVEVEEDACLELEAGAHLFGSITVREGGCLVAQGPVSVRVNATLVLEDGAFIGPAPDVALDADQIQIQIHASNGGTGGPLDTPLPFDSGYASSVHAHVLAPNGTIRLGQSSSNRGSFRGLHVLADIESTITFEGDVDGSFGSAPYFTSTDVTTANVGAEYEYDADAFDADVGDVLTYFLDRRPDWMDIDRNTGEIIWVPRSNQGGDHLVELRVEDLAGNTAVRTFTIVVPLTNQAPSGVADFYRAYEGIPRTLTPAPTLNDDDPDNDLLDFVLMTQPANGTVTIESNGDVTYTSNAAFVGTDSFEYRARDPGGLESANTTVSITVFEANDPPVCVDRVYTVDEDTLLDVASVMGLTVGSSDPESDPVSVFVVSPPAHGTLTVSVDGAFTFLPDVEQTQQVTFDFICHDGRAFAAAPSTATINITPLNDAPLVDAGPDRTEPLGTMVALSGDAFDAEGDVMTFAWTFASVPSGSTAILTGADTPSPTFGTDELGTYNLTLTVTDANGAVDSDSVVITSAPLNRPPEIIEDPVPVARPGRAFNFPTNVNEPDGDTSLTYALVPEPSWLSPFSSTTGTLVGTPTANDLGSYPVTVTVTDPGGLSDTRSYTIEVVADAVPVAVDDTYDAFVDQSLTVAAASGVLANDSDADNDALTASVVTPPSTGSLTLGSDGSLTYDFALVSSSAITEKYHAYSGTGVISTPMVAHLTDDDGDGDIDQDDIPAIVFVTRPGGQFNGGAIVAIRGNDGQVLFTAGGNDIAALNEIAIGDIDGDGLVEIVAAHEDGQHLVAYEHTGAFKWQSTTDVLPGRRDSGGAISIANLDGTGLPEIVIGSSVYDSNGTLLADGRDLGVSAVGYSFFTSISAVADIDLDGTPEIVAGPAAFRFSNGALSLVWHRSDRTDGFVAIGNFDDDPYAEIVINGGNLYILNHDGTDFAPWVTPPPSLGGAPTIADLDGDGDAEIGVLKGGTYRAYEADGTLMWSFVVNDGSVSTGSTVYDFDLDGAVEIVYRDERFLRVFRGSDGAVLTQIEVHNGTGTEQPVVADVDGDGFAELVVSADPLPSGSSSYDTGIHVFEGAPNEWAPTRSIWNQHSYHVTNVNDDGTIPLVEATNWLAPGLNNFRLNTLEPGTHTDSFTYRVNDGAQDSDVATVTITIRPPNTAPTITSDLPLTAYVGVPYVQPIAAFDPDPGDTVTWSAPDAPAFVSLLSTPDRLSFTATQAGSLMLTLRAQDALGAFSLRPYTFQVTTPQTVTVPDVVGLVQATAVGDVDALGLSTSVTSTPDAVVPAGSVVSQTPSAGASATQGDVVALVVSTGPAQINVPDVVGLVEATAASDIAAAGLTVGVTSQAPHPSIASGSVTTQTPSAGVVVDEGTAVDLVVSQGVVVPDVIGATDQAAVNSIAAAGLTTGVVQYVVDLAVAGTVVTQVPAGGTPATANDPVDLVLSLGPQYTTVPLVVGLLEQDATSAVVTADLVVGQIQTQASTAIPAGHIIASTPTGGTVVPDLTAVDLIVSSGAPSVVVPNVVGLTTSAAANTLLTAGLGGSFAGETHPTTPAGEVVRQTPVAGTSVAGGVVVSMFVSVGPASATVPNVVGLSQGAAVAAIAAASLTDAVTSVYHPTIPSGTVVTQSPAAGSVVADGSLVAIDVSQGPAPATVPNVVGFTVAAANSAVAAAGLVVASTYAADAAPVDTVVSQTPAGGATVNDGSVVDLVVSAGPNPQPLPHVVGFLEADAASRIVADGFAVGSVTQATSSSVPAGRVAAQTPPGGAQRPTGSNVDLVVSSGPPVATVPNVVGLAELHAISELTTAGFTTGAIVARHSNVTPYGLVSLQAPGAGVSVEQGSAVDLTISLGPEPDTTAPRVVVDIQPPFIVLGNTVTITVTVTGETLPVTTEVAVNGVPQTVSSGTVTVTPSASGPQVVAVNVADASGNETALTRYFGVDVAGDVTAPTASITTPANADVITEPTPVVGTATDANLLYYELSYRSASDDTFTTIVTSPLGVAADELGVFDPTLLENGLYTLRLEAVDVGGRTSTDEVSVHVDGNMKVGVFTLSFVDLAIPLTGIPITVTRTYDSRVKRTEDFGVGWSLDVAAGRYENNRPLSEGWSITQSAPPGAQACGNQDDLAQYRTTEIRLSDQEYYTFAPYIVAAYPSFGSCYVQVAFGATGGSAPGAVLGIVGNDFAVNPSGADYLLDDITGLPFEISRVRLTTYDGRTFDIDEDDGVVRMEDRNGNEVFVTSSGIIHENGRSVSFVRDAQDRITQIIDPMGETMHYVYDANDDLVSFTDRLGNTTTFEYGRDHYLEKIVDPRGVSAVRSEYDANGRLVATIDPDGNRIELVHDLATRRETVTNRLGDTTYFDYDVRGNVVQETYPDSTFITRTFDLDDNVTTMTDELGRTTTYTHDAYGNVLTESNALGETSTTTYTALGDVATVTDPRGAVTTYGYDGNGNLRFITDPEGNETEMRYDNFGQVILEIDPRGFRRRYQYSGFGQISREVDERDVPTLRTYDANGVMLTETTTRSVGGQVETLVTTYVPDALGRVVQTTFPDGATTSMAYDEAGRVTERTDELGRVTGMVYNARGEQTRMNYPDGTSSSMTYDAEGRMLTRTDRGGRTRTMTYDSRGRMTTTVEPDNATTTREYDSAGQMVASIDPNGNRTEYEYDDAGRLALTRDALLNETTRTYDAAGSLATITNAKDQVTTYFYDLRGLRTRVVYNDASEERMVYDASGNVVTKYDAEDDTMTYAYDGAGLLTAVTDGRGDTWTFAYDELRNRVSQTDPNNHTTSFGFDVRSRETARTLPDSLSETRTYDVRGNLSTRTSYSGLTTTTHGYDLNDRLISRTATDMATVSFGYTPTGRRDQVIDPRGLTDYGYDTRDRMTSIVYPDGSSIVYTYDAAGNLATMQSTVGSTSWTETYGYNERNELTSVEVDSLVFTLSYDETGQVSSIAYPNGVTTTYTYDDVDRLASIVTANDQATVLASYAYTRYPDGNIETITEADGTLYDYAYDEANRLVQATVTSSTSALVYAEGFAFDAAGNRSTRFYTPASGVQETYSYSYDSRDRIQSDATDSYAFDDDGRMVSRGVQALTWNSQDHLVSIDYGDGRFATNSYDTDGVLVAAQLAGTSGTSSATQYLNSLRRDRLPYTIADIDANTGAVVRRFVRAEGTLVGVLGVGGSVAYIHTDHLRSVRATTDATGGVMNATSYAPNGSLQSGAQEPFGYAGERADEASGLGYHRARWLEPNLGMFLSRDPAGGLAGRPASLGSYSYANGDPTNVVDPSGEFGLREVVLVAGIAATLAEIAYVNWSAVRSVIIGGKKISLQTQGIPSEAVFSAAAVAAENELRSVYGPFGFEVNRNGSTFGGHTVQWSRGEGVCHDRGFDAVTPVGSRRSIIKVENIRACLRDIRGTQRSMATENDELIGLLTLTSVHETLHGLRGDQLHRDNGSPNLLMSGPRALGMVLDAGGTFTLSGLKGAGFFTLEPADADRISTR